MVSSKLFTYSILILIFALIITKYFPYKQTHKYVLHINKVSYSKEILQVLPVDGAFGPESFTFDPSGGGPYTGLSDGRVVKWVGDQRRWVDFAFTSPNRDECGKHQNHENVEHICGRPLGLRFNEKTGELYIADAYFGLTVVGPVGGLAKSVIMDSEGSHLGFANGLDIDQQNGLVYFTVSSTRFERRDYMSSILSNDNTGMLLRYNPQTKQVTKLLNNLSFANGVSLSKNKDFLLIVETTSCTITKYWLENNETLIKNGERTETLTELIGFPDNIKINSKGEFWVAIHSKRGDLLKWLLSLNWVGNTIVNLPFNAVKLTSIISKFKAIGLGLKLDENGNILQVLEDTSGKLKFLSEVVEKDGNLWFGSVILPYAGLYKDYDPLK